MKWKKCVFLCLPWYALLVLEWFLLVSSQISLFVNAIDFLKTRALRGVTSAGVFIASTGAEGSSLTTGEKHSAVDEARQYFLLDRWELAFGFKNLKRSHVTKDTVSFFHVPHTDSFPWQTLT